MILSAAAIYLDDIYLKYIRLLPEVLSDNWQNRLKSSEKILALSERNQGQGWWSENLFTSQKQCICPLLLNPPLTDSEFRLDLTQ